MNFSKINDRCNNSQPNIVYFDIQTGPLKTINAKVGYNYLPFDYSTAEGSVIMIQSKGGIIAYEANNTKYLPDLLFGNSALSTTTRISHYVKAYLSVSIPISLFNNYTSIGFYNLSISSPSTKDGSLISSINNVTIDYEIKGLAMTTSFCILNQSCILNSTVTHKNLIDY